MTTYIQYDITYCHFEMDGQRRTKEESKRYFACAQYDKAWYRYFAPLSMTLLIVILRWTVKDGQTKALSI